MFETRRHPADTSRVASRAHAATPDEVAAAVAAARGGPRGLGGRTSASGRRLLHGVSEAIGARHLELAAAASLETGKTRIEAIVEVQEAVELVEAYCAARRGERGYTAPLGLVRRGREQR